MNKYASIYFDTLEKQSDLQTNIQGEDATHLIKRLYEGNVDVNKMLDNASHSHLNVPGLSPLVANALKPAVISGIKTNQPHYMELLKTKIPQDTLKKFIDKNPHVFDSVSNALPPQPIA